MDGSQDRGGLRMLSGTCRRWGVLKSGESVDAGAAHVCQGALFEERACGVKAGQALCASNAVVLTSKGHRCLEAIGV